MISDINQFIPAPGFGLFYVPVHYPEISVSFASQLKKIEEQVIYADSNGWNNVWLAEHHGDFYGGIINSPEIFCSFPAAKTNKIRLGPAISVLPLHDPRHLAERYSLLDHLSDGRLDMGIGRGFLASEFELFGIRMEDSKARFKEAHSLLLAAWKDKEITFSGEFYQYKSAGIHPDCLQKPHPPIWVAASNTRESFELAGLNGHNLMINPYTRTNEEIEEGLGIYFSSLSRAGIAKSKVRVAAMQHLYCGDVDDMLKTAFKNYLTSLAIAAKSFSKKHNTTHSQKNFESITLEKVSSDKVLFGTPKDIIPKIEKWLKNGITDFCLMPQFGGLPWDVSMNSLQRFTNEVKPYFSQAN